MRYLSFDLEATGLREDDLIIEFGMVPFCTKELSLNHELSYHTFVKCPSFSQLKPNLDQWVIDHNEELITKAHTTGITLGELKTQLENYLQSKEVKSYFGEQKITLFGKSMSAIDLPFLNRDLNWNWMRKHFEHRQLDLSSVAYQLIDMGLLPESCTSGSALSKELGFGEVAHTALEDAKNTALMYIEVLKRFSKK